MKALLAADFLSLYATLDFLKIYFFADFLRDREYLAPVSPDAGLAIRHLTK